MHNSVREEDETVETGLLSDREMKRVDFQGIYNHGVPQNPCYRRSKLVNKCLRRILWIWRPETISNEALWNRAGSNYVIVIAIDYSKML